MSYGGGGGSGLLPGRLVDFAPGRSPPLTAGDRRLTPGDITLRHPVCLLLTCRHTCIYRVVQKSGATTFKGSDLCMPTSSKCPNVYDKFYEYGVNRCIRNITALK